VAAAGKNCTDPDKPMPNFNWEALLPLLALGVGGAVGGKAGLTGAAQGVTQGLQSNQQLDLRRQQLDLQRQDQAAQQMYWQEQIAARQAAAMQAEQGRKQTAILRAGQVLPTAETEDEYTAALTALAAESGMRPAALQALFPFRPPTTAQAVGRVLEKFVKNPANADAFTKPGWEQGVISVEIQKGKPPVTMSIGEAMKAAGSEFPILMDPKTGEPIVAPKGTKPEIGDRFQALVTEYEAEFTAQHGRPPTPGTERKELIEKAIKNAHDLQVTDKPILPRYQLTPYTTPDGQVAGLARINVQTGEVIPVQLPEGTQPGRASAATQEKTAARETTRVRIEEIGRMFEDFGKGLVGPVAGRALRAKMAIPGAEVSEAEATFVAEVDALTNQVIKEITGAQMSEPEAARIKRQLPKVEDKPSVFRARLAATLRNLDEMRQQIQMRGRATPGASWKDELNQRKPY
jgi:hypothetical protein